MNMNKEEFLKALSKEGLLIYGTTWLENFKRLQELKKYKEMWREFKDRCGGCEMMNYVGKVRTMREVLEEYEQKYFPPQKTVLTLEINSQDIENDLKEIYGFINSANGGAVEEFHGHITLTGIKDVQES